MRLVRGKEKTRYCFGCSRVLSFCTSALLSEQSKLNSFAQHGASATSRAAEAGMGALRRPCMRFSELQIVIVGQFLSRSDIAAGIDEDFRTLFFDLAVGGARVINPAPRVTSPGGVDDQVVLEREEHCVRRMLM